jgi:predicted AlkP superfamily pyrophosphatase or phosphodiesterase
MRVTGFIAVLLVLSMACQGQKEEAKASKLLLISFDGFRHDYFEKVPTPHFDKIIAGGVKAEGLIPVFPTKTFPNHYSIATGLYPENTGLISNTMYDRERDAFYRIGSREAVEDGYWYAGDPIWNTAEAQGLVAGTLFWVGSEAPVNGRQASYWKVYDDDLPYRARVDTVITWFTQTDRPAVDFATLYFSEVDSKGHAFGPEHEEVYEAIKRADELLGYLMEQLAAAGLADQVNILIVSDHGMAELSEDRVILIDQIIDVTRVQMVDWTPVSMINLNDPEYAEEAVAKLKAAAEERGTFRVYTKDEIPEHWRLKNHPRTTDVIVVSDNGYTITSRNRLNFFIQGLPSGTHGYDNAAKDMEGIFLAYGPDLKKGLEIPSFENVHIYALMCKLLGITPSAHDGNPEVLQGILK